MTPTKARDDGQTTDNPYANLENAAKKQAAEEKAAAAISEARVRLVLGRDAPSTFFATLALRLVAEPDWKQAGLATDGKRLVYNPEFIAGMTAEEIRGCVVHEVCHNALMHPSRCGGRDQKKFNIAADLAINPMILESGYKLPKCRLVPGEGKYKDKKWQKGLSAEEYYTLIEQDEPPPGDKPDDSGGDGDGEGQGDGDGQGDGQGNDPGQCGGVDQPGDGSQAAQQESKAEWEVAVAQAHQTAKKRGNLPGMLERLVQEVLAPKVDWKEVLREFISRYSRNDYSWSPPNRRFIHMGIYLPGLRSEELGDIVIAIDTSGSIGQKELSTFGSEVQGILDGFDCSLTILYHDSKVAHVQQWKSSDGPLVLEAKGGGGTDHHPVFDWIAEHGDPPTCLVCLTDMYSSFPDKAPEYPTLWAVVGNESAEAPFGQLVQVEA